MTALTVGTHKEGNSFTLDADDLTTHGVIVGMTGSGKTGLAVVLLEELRLARIPTLILDPKGDMPNLALTFPELSESDFAPWVGQEEPSAIAKRWRSGLEKSPRGPADLRVLKGATDLAIYTPGSNAGQPLSVLGSLKAPASWDDLEEAAREEIGGFTAALLGLLEIESDPLTSPEHILVANLIEHAWKNGRSVDLVSLLAMITDPPLRKLGVMDLEAFYPRKERQKLALRLNGLLASPGFSTWLEGDPLDVRSLLWTANGTPRTSIVYLSHLNEAQRQMVVATLLAKVTTWMRGEPGSDSLRALIYMDEVFGFAPPTRNPPTKQPILTILKQARAYGVGMVLATQNPVDLDYKTMSNAGLWCVGRLQTERDVERISSGLRSAGTELGESELQQMIAAQEKRHFLVHNVRAESPVEIASRWAMSYLAGPITKSQLASLVPARDNGPAAATEPRKSTADDSNYTGAAPTPPATIRTRYVRRDAQWIGVDIAPSGNLFRPAVAMRVETRFDERKADVNVTLPWEVVVPVQDAHANAQDGVPVDFEDRDFADAPAEEGARYRVVGVNLSAKKFYQTLERELKEWLRGHRTETIWRNSALRLYGRVGETKEAFLARCDRLAQDKADEAAAELRDKTQKRLDRLERQAETAQERVEAARDALNAQKRTELTTGAGSLLQVFLGATLNTRSIARRAATQAGSIARRRGQTARAQSRLEREELKIDQKETEIASLEAELVREIAELNDEWEAKGRDVEEIEIGLERDDVRIVETSLIWIPTGA